MPSIGARCAQNTLKLQAGKDIGKTSILIGVVNSRVIWLVTRGKDN